MSDRVDGTPDVGQNQPEVRQHTAPIQDAWIGWRATTMVGETFLDNEKEAMKMGMDTNTQHCKDPWSSSGLSSGPTSYERTGASQWVDDSWPGPNFTQNKWGH